MIPFRRAFKEMPDLVKTHERYPRGFEVVVVAMFFYPLVFVKKFLEKNGLPFPVACPRRSCQSVWRREGRTHDVRSQLGWTVSIAYRRHDSLREASHVPGSGAQSMNRTKSSARGIRTPTLVLAGEAVRPAAHDR